MSSSNIDSKWLAVVKSLSFPMVYPSRCKFSDDSLSQVLKITNRFMWLAIDIYGINSLQIWARLKIMRVRVLKLPYRNDSAIVWCWFKIRSACA